MSFDAALQFLVIAYAVVGIAVIFAGLLFTVRLLVKIIRRSK